MEFIGYRAWRLGNPKDGLLKAAVMDYCWDGPVLAVPDDDWPHIATGRGYHSWKTLGGATEYGQELLRHRHGRNTVVPQCLILGSVRHYGLVAEYELGYRSSHVLVTKLWVPRVWDDGFRQMLAERYQCEVEGYSLTDVGASFARDGDWNVAKAQPISPAEANLLIAQVVQKQMEHQAAHLLRQATGFGPTLPPASAFTQQQDPGFLRRLLGGK